MNDTDFLIKAIREQSGGNIKVVSGGKHFKLIWTKDTPGNKRGQAVKDDNGPLILSGSPSEGRNRQLALNRLLKAGALKYDPWNPPEKTRTAPRMSEEARLARREGVAAASRRAEENTQALRERVEPLIVRIGPWDKRGFKAEFGETAYKFLEEIQYAPRWPSKDSAVMSATSLSKGNTLSASSVESWSRFIQELENTVTPRERYFELVRFARGAGGARVSLPAAVRSDSSGLVSEVTAQDNGSVSEHVAGVLSKMALPSVFEFVNLAQIHERTGLRWSMGLTIDQYAELQRAVGFLEAVVVRDYGDKGEQALATFSNFLIKMAEARFYSMMGREEASENT